MRETIQAFKAFLKRRGYKITGQRIAVLNEILSMDGHFEAKDLCEKFKGRTDVSRATIYRTLQLLLESGLIREAASEEKHPHYERAIGEFHGHLICLNCGEIIEFPEATVSELQRQISDKYDFELKFGKFEIFGVCRRCRGMKDETLVS
jgi:Fur family ferric uptake transcriptional regulator